MLSRGRPHFENYLGTRGTYYRPLSTSLLAHQERGSPEIVASWPLIFDTKLISHTNILQITFTALIPWTTTGRTRKIRWPCMPLVGVFCENPISPKHTINTMLLCTLACFYHGNIFLAASAFCGAESRGGKMGRQFGCLPLEQMRRSFAFGWLLLLLFVFDARSSAFSRAHKHRFLVTQGARIRWRGAVCALTDTSQTFTRWFSRHFAPFLRAALLCKWRQAFQNPGKQGTSRRSILQWLFCSSKCSLIKPVFCTQKSYQWIM